MCGIVGYVGKRPVVDLLLKGLKLLEYRGYDSAGVAFFENGKIRVRKSEGRLENVAKILAAEAPSYQLKVRNRSHALGHSRQTDDAKCPSSPD